jgi:hypothetical protein
MTAAQAGLGQNDTVPGMTKYQIAHELSSLSGQELVDAVAKMLKANGYQQVKRPESAERTQWHIAPDLRCKSPDNRLTYVWCLGVRPFYTLTSLQVLSRTSEQSVVPIPYQTMFVTTGVFTIDALDMVASGRITLIDGSQLVEMMQRVQPQ